MPNTGGHSYKLREGRFNGDVRGKLLLILSDRGLERTARVRTYVLTVVVDLYESGV